MKQFFFLLAMSYSLTSMADDSLKAEPRVYHEAGLNVTLLVKQVVSLGASNIPISPYNLTYKFIYRNWAARAGFGIELNNNSSTVKGASDPRESKSSQLFFRIGAERQFKLSPRFTSYIGLDFVGLRARSRTVLISINDNLPNSYNYQRSTTTGRNKNQGGGPVLGIQFDINKRLSLFTEASLYLVSGKILETSEIYQKSLPFNGAEFIETTKNDEFTATYRNLSVISPATLYLSFKL